MEAIPNEISKLLVKAMTLLALQPVASGAHTDELNYNFMVKNFGYIELFLEVPYFMLGYAGMPSRSSWWEWWLAILSQERHLQVSTERGGDVSFRAGHFQQAGDWLHRRLGSGAARIETIQGASLGG